MIMKPAYIDKILNLSSTEEEKKRRSVRPDDLEKFYRLGQSANHRGMSVTDALRSDAILDELKYSSEKEAEYFSLGLLGNEMPPPPVQVVEQKEPPKRPPAPVVEMARPQIVNISQPPDEMDGDLKLLKTLIGLLEKKLAQPVIIHNEIVTPKLKSSEDTVKRDDNDNIKGKSTKYEYEDRP